MAVTPACLAAAGERLLGSRYRLYGRDPQFGLDCVGVILAAFAACGRSVPTDLPYAMRNRSVAGFPQMARALGLKRIDGAAIHPVTGDVIVVRPGPAQWHLLLAISADQCVHAHAGLRQVALAPLPLPHPLRQCWRLAPIS